MKSAQAPSLLFTCEHGGNKIPKRYQPFFKKASAALKSHRGWDPGALAVARDLARKFRAPLIFAETSRLLVDLNRSEYHKNGFSEFSDHFSASEKEEILDQYHRPYRQDVMVEIEKLIKRRPVLHLSMHSLTPVLHGVVRTCDLSLLYDPKSPFEKRVSAQLKEALKREFPELRIRMNYPYLGYTDGFTTHLRKKFGSRNYAGIEIELNQQLVQELESTKERPGFSKKLARAIESVLESK